MIIKDDDEFISNYIITNDASKISTKRLFKIVETRWPDDLWNIFDPKDDCFCSAVARKRYKTKFKDHYEKNRI